jgi:hypothetical protein
VRSPIGPESCARQLGDTAWIYTDETTEPIRHAFQVVANEGAVGPGALAIRDPNRLTVGAASRSHRCELRTYLPFCSAGIVIR